MSVAFGAGAQRNEQYVELAAKKKTYCCDSSSRPRPIATGSCRRSTTTCPTTISWCSRSPPTRLRRTIARRWRRWAILTLGRRFLGVTHDIIDDRIDVVDRGMLGLTVGVRPVPRSQVRPDSRPTIITRSTACSRTAPSDWCRSPSPPRATRHTRPSRRNSRSVSKRWRTPWQRPARKPLRRPPQND